MVEIGFHHVEKRFKEVIAVRDLSLTIRPREFFTFVGPSGCGKSTILSMLAGLEEVTRGTISFDGQTVNTLSPRERDVAMVFQSYALYPHMNVYDNMAFPLKVRKMKPSLIDIEVRRAAALLSLENLLGRKPRHLSGGQQQRVALGRAIVRRPKVFLMDEPLSNLDARLRVEMKGELKKLHRELGITTVYVTHDQEEAMSISDRIAVMEDGCLRQCGEPRVVYNQPANVFVAGFIGSPPMNLLDGNFLAEIPSLESLPARLLTEGVTAGIRPSDVLVHAGLGEGGLSARVLLIEHTGTETWVDGDRAGVSLKGRLAPGEAVAVGAQARFDIRAAKLHFFDKATGERLAPEAS